MSVTPITLKNLKSTPLSFALNFARDRQYNGTLTPGQTTDLSSIATVDEVSRNAQIQSLLAKGAISVTTSTLGSTDLADPALTLVASDISQAGRPTLTFASAAISAGTPIAITLNGSGFLQGMSKASLNSGSNSGSTCGVTFTALRPGNSGNLITLVLIVSGGGSTVASNVTTITGGGAYTGIGEIASPGVTITLTYGSTTTAATIVTSIKNSANESSALLTAAALAGGTSSRTFNGGAVSPGTTALLSGGGSGANLGNKLAPNNFQVLVGGLQQDVSSASSGVVSDTAITVVPVSGSLTGLAAGNIVQISVLSNGMISQPLSMVLAT